MVNSNPVKKIVSALFVIVLCSCAGVDKAPQVSRSLNQNPRLFCDNNCRSKSKKFSHLKEVLKFYESIQPHYDSIDLIALPHDFGFGDKSEAIVRVRQKLSLLGYRILDTNSPVLDEKLAKVLYAYRFQNSLSLQNIIDSSLINMLNQPLSRKIEKIKYSVKKQIRLDRAVQSHPKFVLVDIADFKVFLYQNGRLIKSLKAVTGHPSRETPEINSAISSVTLNPTWYVPYSIAKKDILPKIKNNPSLVAAQGYNIRLKSRRYGRKILDPNTWDAQKFSQLARVLSISQSPGPDNPMGDMKFYFSNSYRVFVHGASSEKVFKRHKRALSSGCIRLKRPLVFAKFLFSNQPETIRTLKLKLQEKDLNYKIKLRQPVPIRTVYRLARIDKNGTLHLQPDIYKVLSS